MAQGPVAELPAPSNIPLCMCIPYTLAEGHGTDPQSFGKGKPPSNQSQLWLSRGWRQTLWKYWLLSIPSGLGGAEVRKSNQEREKRKYQEKKGEGNRVNVADITQLRRGSCTWKIHHLVVTEETDTFLSILSCGKTAVHTFIFKLHFSVQKACKCHLCDKMALLCFLLCDLATW